MKAAGRHRARPVALPEVLLLMDGAVPAPRRPDPGPICRMPLMAIQAELGNTVIMITHDVDEGGAALRSHRHDDQRPQRHGRGDPDRGSRQGPETGSPWRMIPTTTSCASRCCTSSTRSSAR